MSYPRTHCNRCGKPAYNEASYKDQDWTFCDEHFQDFLSEIAESLGQEFLDNKVKHGPNPHNKRPTQHHFTCISCGYISAFDTEEEAKEDHLKHDCEVELQKRHADWAGFMHNPTVGEIVLWVDPAHETTQMARVDRIADDSDMVWLTGLDAGSEIEALSSELRPLPPHVLENIYLPDEDTPQPDDPIN